MLTGGHEIPVHYSKSQSGLCQNGARRWRPDLLGGMTAADSGGGGGGAAEGTGRDAAVQGAGTMAAGTGGSSWTGITSCTGSGMVGWL